LKQTRIDIAFIGFWIHLSILRTFGSLADHAIRKIFRFPAYLMDVAKGVLVDGDEYAGAHFTLESGGGDGSGCVRVDLTGLLGSGRKSGKGKKGLVVVGRKKGKCGMVVDHSSLSRKHAVFAMVGGEKNELYVVDLESSNGTFLNDKRIQPNQLVRIYANDKLAFGKSSRVYRLMSHGEVKVEKVADRPAADKSALETRQAPAKSQEEMSRFEREAAIKAMTNSMLSSKPEVQVANVPKKQVSELPISEQVSLEGHRKAACCVAVDRAGSRFVTGAYDFQVLMWDFGGMNKDHRAFRSFVPTEGTAVVSLSFSPSGNAFLVVPADSQAKVFDREGVELALTAKGDPYLHDMNKTRGHPSTITCGCWHPVHAKEFLTCGIDGTCRIWDLDSSRRTMVDNELICSAVLKTKGVGNARIQVNCCTYSPGGDLIAAGCSDGSIQMWKVKSAGGSYSRPCTIVRPAHERAVTCLKFSPNGLFIASRGEDGKLILWGRSGKSLRQVWASNDLLATDVPQTGLAFSPDNQFIVTCESEKGSVVFFRTKGSNRQSPIVRHSVCNGEPKRPKTVAVEWHSKLNQIFVTCGDGSVHILFDRELSEKGALLSTNRSASTRREYFAGEEKLPNTDDIILPNALKMYKKEIPVHRSKAQEEKILRKDPTLTKQPGMKPSSAEDMHGRLGVTSGGQFYRDLLKDDLKTSEELKLDPREELIRHDRKRLEQGGPEGTSNKRHKGDNDGLNFGLTSVYSTTQPKKQFAKVTQEAEEEQIALLKNNLQAYQKLGD